MLAEAELRARSRAENFTVASRLLPGSVREHLMAFYCYARLVDEIGDTFSGDRRAALDDIDRQVGAALLDPDAAALPTVVRAARSIRTLGTDPQPLFDLIQANRQDQEVHEYDTFEDLLDYCRLSANPVGHLVLAAFRARTSELIGWSDAICTGLQLAEHWQDVAEDAAAGRCYLPREDLERFGVDRRELTEGSPAGRGVRALMVFEVARARRLLDEGRGLIHALRGPARWAVAGFWAGGHAALDAIADHRFDVLAGAPPRSRIRTAALTARAALRAEAA